MKIYTKQFLVFLSMFAVIFTLGTFRDVAQGAGPLCCVGNQLKNNDGSINISPAVVPTQAATLAQVLGAVASIPWSHITSTPTTLSGYGITDAYPLTGNPSNFLVPGALTGFVNSLNDNFISTQHSSVATVVSTTPTLDTTVQVNAILTTTAISAGTITMKVVYTDENSIVQTVTLLTVTSVGLNDVVVPIRALGGTGIVVSTTFVGVSTTYDVGASLIKIST